MDACIEPELLEVSDSPLTGPVPPPQKGPPLVTLTPPEEVSLPEDIPSDESTESESPEETVPQEETVPEEETPPEFSMWWNKFFFSPPAPVPKDLLSTNPLFVADKDSQIVVVMIDDVPQFYAKSLEAADVQVEQILGRMKRLQQTGNYRVYINCPSENVFEVTRVYNLFVMQYEEVVCRIEYKVIPTLSEFPSSGGSSGGPSGHIIQ